MRGAIVLALVLGGCVGGNAQAPSASYRDTSVAISSSSRFDAHRFAGGWTRLAAFGPRFKGADCRAVRFTPLTGRGMAVEDCGGRAGATTSYSVAPFGRLEGAGTDPIWVLWVAEDFGTAVLGTPSGAFGWILNRGTRIQPDRYTAARELLEFNGYDISRLERLY